MPRARPQVVDNDALTHVDVPQLVSTGGGFFYVRAGQTHRTDLHLPLGAALTNALRS